MTKKEIKQQLKNAYALSPSKEGKSFIRKYQKRKMHLKDIIPIQMRYMGIGSLLAGIVLCVIICFITRHFNAPVMWVISSFLPVTALIPLTAMGRSEYYGMSEFEASCRFSLRFIKMIRMMILGIASLLMIVICVILTHGFMNISLVDALAYAGFPYLFNILASLHLIRKWHAKENIYGCMAITAISAMIPLLSQFILTKIQLSTQVIAIALGILLIVTIGESILYIRESENVSWNLN